MHVASPGTATRPTDRTGWVAPKTSPADVALINGQALARYLLTEESNGGAGADACALLDRIHLVDVQVESERTLIRISS